jgi:hypothetical protein
MMAMVLTACSSPFSPGAAAFPSDDSGPSDNSGYPGSAGPWSKVGDKIVFSANQPLESGGYSLGDGYDISGSGTIKVSVKNLTKANKEEFGIEFGTIDFSPSSFLFRRICFYIKDNGTYCIYWFDGTNSSSPITWKTSTSINTGYNSTNELRVNYNTNTRTFSFFINNSPALLTKTFSSISTGRISYYTSLRSTGISENYPYRLEFKTTSPHTYP